MKRPMLRSCVPARWGDPSVRVHHGAGNGGSSAGRAHTGEQRLVLNGLSRLLQEEHTAQLHARTREENAHATRRATGRVPRARRRRTFLWRISSLAGNISSSTWCTCCRCSVPCACVRWRAGQHAVSSRSAQTRQRSRATRYLLLAHVRGDVKLHGGGSASARACARRAGGNAAPQQCGSAAQQCSAAPQQQRQRHVPPPSFPVAPGECARRPSAPATTSHQRGRGLGARKGTGGRPTRGRARARGCVPPPRPPL
jgi:hypothetical protein